MLKIVIETTNAAFDPDPIPELIRLLQVSSLRLLQGDTEVKLRDSNGNVVGYMDLVHEDETV